MRHRQSRKTSALFAFLGPLDWATGPAARDVSVAALPDIERIADDAIMRAPSGGN